MLCQVEWPTRSLFSIGFFGFATYFVPPAANLPCSLSLKPNPKIRLSSLNSAS